MAMLVRSTCLNIKWNLVRSWVDPPVERCGRLEGCRFLSNDLKERVATITLRQLYIEAFPSDYDRKLRTFVPSTCCQSSPLGAIQSRRGRMVFRVGVPLA